jgi:hypothetical protein
VSEELAKFDRSSEQETAALRREQDSFRAEFEQEIAGLRQQLDDDIAELRREQAKLTEGAAASPKPQLGQLAQKIGLER